MRDIKNYLVIGMLLFFSIIIFVSASEKLNNSILHWILLGGFLICFGWLIYEALRDSGKK